MLRRESLGALRAAAARFDLTPEAEIDIGEVGKPGQGQTEEGMGADQLRGFWLIRPDALAHAGGRLA